jgi:hypothetical protein
MKFLHTMGAIGLMGAMACLVAMLIVTPAPATPGGALAAQDVAGYLALRSAMGQIATWVLLPSLATTLVAGLLAMAVNPGFHNAGWALVKLATGILIFEWGFAGIVGPMQNEAELAAQVLAGQAQPSALGVSLGAEQGSLWVMLGIATLNVVLGVWRPRLKRRRAAAASALSDASAANVVRDQSV